MDLVRACDLVEAGYKRWLGDVNRALKKKGLEPVVLPGKGGANGYPLKDVLRVVPGDVAKRLLAAREAKNRPDSLQRASLRADGKAPMPAGAIRLDQTANARALAIDEILRVFESFKGEKN